MNVSIRIRAPRYINSSELVAVCEAAATLTGVTWLSARSSWSSASNSASNTASSASNAASSEFKLILWYAAGNSYAATRLAFAGVFCNLTINC